jgi:hypothetical protein
MDVCVGICVGCREKISFNPARVPSIVVDEVRLPICKNCAEKANVARIKQGFETFQIYPDSYAPPDESEA